MTDTEVDAFLEHFGIKGMKWGVHQRGKKGDWKKRSGGQKTALVVGGLSGWVASGQVTKRLLGNKAPLTQLAIGIGSGVVGARLVRNFLDRKGKTKTSSLPAVPKPQKTKEEIKKRRTKIAVGAAAAAAVTAGLVGTSLILDHHGRVVANDLKIKHPDFVQDHIRLHGKLKERMADLRDLANQTGRGHPSHEGAMNEIKNLHSFYDSRLSKMSNRYGIDPKTLKKMKLRSAL